MDCSVNGGETYQNKRKLKHEMAKQLKKEFGSILSWGNDDSQNDAKPPIQDTTKTYFNHNEVAE